MDIPEVSPKRVARLLSCNVEQIDLKRLRHAVSHVKRQTTEYWDMLGNHCQLHGNCPPHMCVALMYASL